MGKLFDELGMLLKTPLRGSKYDMETFRANELHAWSTAHVFQFSETYEQRSSTLEEAQWFTQHRMLPFASLAVDEH